MINPSFLSLVVAAGLGLRHALDPDHLVAVGGLVTGRGPVRRREQALIAAAWGAGHATTLIAAGALVLLAGQAGPLAGGSIWERFVGVAIVAVGLRLLALLLARRTPAAAQASAPRRSALMSFGVGLVHGLAGSGGVTLALLPLAAVGVRLPALVIFAIMAGVSMVGCVLIATGFLGAGRFSPKVRRWGAIAVALGSILFGLGYAVVA